MAKKLIKLIEDFITIGPAARVHIIVYQVGGAKREMLLPITVGETKKETLSEKVQRIRNTPDLKGEDLAWWKDIQLKLGQDAKAGNQIELDDPVEKVLEKLATIGVTE